MKKILLSTAIAAASLGMVAMSAHAADGQIDFNGSITGTTCTINGGTGQNFSVTLPAVSTATLATAGSWAGRTPVPLNLTNCTPATGTAHVYLEPGPTINTATGRLIVDAGGATNVEIGLLNKNFADIVAGAADGSQNTDVVDIGSGSADLSFYAQYVSLGGATAGAADSRVQYTIVYQ